MEWGWESHDHGGKIMEWQELLKDLKEGDRVIRKDGRDFLGGVYQGTVDQIIPRTGGEGVIVYVKTRHQGFSDSQSMEIEDLVKVEDYKITVDQFMEEAYYWLIKKSVKAKGEQKEAYDEVITRMVELKSHIGY